MPDRYAWLNDYTPSDTYEIVLVRGLRRAALSDKGVAASLSTFILEDGVVY